MRISPFLEDFAFGSSRRGCTSAGLHARRVEDNTPYLLGSGYADLGQTRPTLRANGQQPRALTRRYPFNIGSPATLCYSYPVCRGGVTPEQCACRKRREKKPGSLNRSGNHEKAEPMRSRIILIGL